MVIAEVYGPNFFIIIFYLINETVNGGEFENPFKITLVPLYFADIYQLTKAKTKATR